MREMKDSGVDWIGSIPEHWELRRAKSMFKQSTSKGNDRLVLLSATQDRGVVDKSTLDSVVQVSEDADLSTFKTVHKNDFVISLRSFQGGFEISHEEGVISPAYTVFRLSTQTYPHYYRHLFKSYGFIDKINSLTVGIREGKNIQYVDFANMLLPYISLAEQQKIAEFLDRKCAEVDEMIGLQEQIIEELKAYKQSVITEAVTKGLNPNAPMRDSGIEWIGQIPEHWEVGRMKNVATGFSNGTSTTQLSSEESPYAVTRIETISTGYINYNKVGYIPFFEGINKYELVKSDILISNINSLERVGNSAMYNGEQKLYHGMNLLRVHSNDRMIALFLHYYLRSKAFLEQMKSYCNHAINQVSVSSSTLKNLFVAMPDIVEQQAIADYLDEKCADIDSLIQTKQSKIDSLKEYKKSIIYEYVTGKREVNE